MVKEIGTAGIQAVEVAVAIILNDEKQVLLEYDSDWRAFSFPMSKRQGSEAWERAAARAAAETLGCLCRPKEIFETPDYAISDRDKLPKRFLYKCFLCEIKGTDFQPMRQVVWTRMDLIAKEGIEPIPLPTRQLARAIIANAPGLFEKQKRKSSGSS